MRDLRLTTAFRDATAAALLAALLALPMLGFQLTGTAQGLTLDTRFPWVGYAALTVFCGRLALSLAGQILAPLFKAKLSLPFLLAAPPGRLRNIAGWTMVVLAIGLPLTPFTDRNLLDKATLLLIYVMLGWGLNIVVGLAGLLDLGYVAFYAVGAYSYALLSQNFGLSFWLCLPFAGALAASFGILLGFPVLRLRGDYLAIVTLGFGEIVRVILLNWQDVTNGPVGISGIQRPSFFGLPFLASQPGHTTFHEFFGIPFSTEHRIYFLYYLILALALTTNIFTHRIRRLPIGRAWEALREDETACRSLGIDPTKTKLSAFALGAMFAGFAGSFFATRQGFISPESFTFIESAIILAIVVLGGMGSQIGIVLAAILLVGLPEWFRELQQYRMLAFGGAMVLIMLWRPRGLLANREPTLRLPPLAAENPGERPK
ncbi:MAG TPA: high-affinity branched-chain amino acid ABC transporter permease LivM [Rhodospirillaceae bacterium]|nr:high-affinity branched-chain amino acid ABC transporter permease LivM [Rhodospirillaceae bacterium]